MIASEIWSYIKAKPFRPFKLCLTDGQQIMVARNDLAILSPNGREVNVYEPDNSHHLFDVALVRNIDLAAHIDQSPSSNRKSN